MKELSELLSLEDAQIRDFLTHASASEDDKSSLSSSQRGVGGVSGAVSGVTSGVATPVNKSGGSTPVRASGDAASTAGAVG